MINIEIEDSVYKALESKVKRFGEKPNDVIKRLLIDSEPTEEESSARNGHVISENGHPLVKLVSSPEFLRDNAKERYFAVLKFLYKDKPQEFAKLNGYKKGSRIQISTDEIAIKTSGRHTWPQKLYDTPYWVSSNLSNDRKRIVLEDVLKLLLYENDVIAAVLKTI
jgi:negative regulator of replication initiation